jgi:[glutamine synthetase] adenylyltransferase / [glutamine synthetase]-adenylyl-L-tyrosine phosphorylase
MTASSSAPAAKADHSRFVQRIRRRYDGERTLFAQRWPGVPLKDILAALVEHLQTQGRALGEALRVARQLTIERLATLDVEEHTSLGDVTAVMTQLAELSLDMALTQALAEQDAIHGAPLNEQGQRIDLWVVGMGKLGGRELNVSSDIDLVYVYDTDGMTTGASGPAISAHEYFSLAVRRLYALIGDTTEDGFVFRVDLALRPNGNSGPPVVSLSGRIFPGARPRVGTFCLAQKPHRGPKGRHAGWRTPRPFTGAA